MTKGTMTGVCVDVGMHGMSPVTHKHFTGAKSKVQHLLKLAKIYLCSSKIISHLNHRIVATHTSSKSLIFNICLSSLACQLWAHQAQRQAVLNSGWNCHTREGFTATERGWERGTVSSAVKTRAVLLQLSNSAAVLYKWLSGTRAFLVLFSSFSFSILSLEAPDYM